MISPMIKKISRSRNLNHDTRMGRIRDRDGAEAQLGCLTILPVMAHAPKPPDE